jgi:hypothetical protein
MRIFFADRGLDVSLPFRPIGKFRNVALHVLVSHEAQHLPVRHFEKAWEGQLLPR